MAVRPYWKGYLKLSLVTCPVQMMPGTSENEKVCFHTLNRETQNRVVSHYVDSVTGKEVREEDEVKGYQRGEDEYIILEILRASALSMSFFLQCSSTSKTGLT
jgi:DNA end-binding protein Ku